MKADTLILQCGVSCECLYFQQAPDIAGSPHLLFEL